MNFPEDDGTDEGGIVRCECGQAVPCRHCPTPIDPADIRPGDVRWLPRNIDLELLRNPHLVHRPDPDAEAVEALARHMFGGENVDEYDREVARASLAALREQGWDVVRRAEP